MNPQAAVAMRYKSELEAITDETKRKEREEILIVQEQRALDIQAALGASNIIDPRDSRRYLIRTLKWLRDKKEERAPRKHENIRI
jgi:propionyl-CoA carboxylase beta chain